MRHKPNDEALAASRRRRNLERRAPPLAARTLQRLHPDQPSMAAALIDQRRQRGVEQALALRVAAVPSGAWSAGLFVCCGAAPL
jgi:hypothetical protein